MAEKRRGIALFTVLVILGLLVIMTTSFVAINHGNFALMAAATDQEEAVGACQAGYSYAFYALEHDRRFGKDFQEGKSPTKQQLQDLAELFTVAVVDSHTLTAKLKDQNGSFTLEVVNNLPLDSIDTTARIPASAEYPEVPSDCVFLRVTGTSGGVNRVLETMFTYAPLIDSSADGDNQININSSEGITFDSLDRFRNFVRSNGNINLQESQRNSPVEFRWKAMEDELFVKLKDLTKNDVPKPSDAALKGLVEDILRGRKGDMKTKADVFIKGKSMSEDMERRVDEERKANGHISPMSTRESKLLDIKFEDFRLSDKATQEVEIKEGLYVFGSADYAVYYKGNAVYVDAAGGEHMVEGQSGGMAISFPALERQEIVSATDNEITQTKTVERWVNKSNFPKEGANVSDYGVPTPPESTTATANGWTFKTWQAPPQITYVNTDYGNGEGEVSIQDEIEDRRMIHEIDGNKVKLSDIVKNNPTGVDDDAVSIDIRAAEFRVRENTLLKTSANFGVLAERDRYSAFAKNNGELDTSYGRDLDAKIYLGVTAGTMKAKEIAFGTEPAAVQAPGRMRVRNVRGRGALVAGEDLILAAGGDTKNDELALYAGKDIILDPKANLQGSTGQESEATTTTDDNKWAPSDGPVNCFFRGLVYARENFIIGNSDESFDVKVEGSLVARNRIDIMNAKKVDLTYNAIFSKRMLKDRPDYDVRLERQSYNLF